MISTQVRGSLAIDDINIFGQHRGWYCAAQWVLQTSCKPTCETWQELEDVSRLTLCAFWEVPQVVLSNLASPANLLHPTLRAQQQVEEVSRLTQVHLEVPQMTLCNQWSPTNIL